MKPEVRPKSPRFLQSSIENVFQDVVTSMGDHRKTQKWNREVPNELGLGKSTSPRESLFCSEESIEQKIEVTRIA